MKRMKGLLLIIICGLLMIFFSISYTADTNKNKKNSDKKTEKTENKSENPKKDSKNKDPKKPKKKKDCKNDDKDEDCDLEGEFEEDDETKEADEIDLSDEEEAVDCYDEGDDSDDDEEIDLEDWVDDPEEELLDDIWFDYYPPPEKFVEAVEIEKFQKEYEDYLEEEGKAAVFLEMDEKCENEEEEKEMERIKKLEAELEKERSKYYFSSSKPGVKPNHQLIDDPIKKDDPIDYEEPINNLGYDKNDQKFFTKTNRPKPEDILEEIRSGRPNILKIVSYEEMKSLVELLQDEAADYEEGSRYTDPAVVALLQDSKSDAVRRVIMKGLVGGLYNKDPRVRLITIRFFRRMIPDEEMRKIIKPIMKLETVGKKIRIETKVYSKRKNVEPELKMVEKNGDVYSYVTIKGVDIQSMCYEELRKLWKFIERRRFLAEIRKGSSTVIREMNREEFNVIAEPIDNEVYCVIPLNHIEQQYLPALVGGLAHPDVEIAERCAESLIRIMRLEKTYRYERLKIFTLIKSTPFQKKILKSFSIQEIADLNDKKALDLFMEKNGYQEECHVVDDDRYDSPKGKYYRPPNYKYKPVLNKRDYKWNKKKKATTKKNTKKR